MLCHLEDIRSRHIHTGLDAAETHHATIKPLPDQGGPVGDGGDSLFSGGYSFFWIPNS